jgi:hypothetical protein
LNGTERRHGWVRVLLAGLAAVTVLCLTSHRKGRR